MDRVLLKDGKVVSYFDGENGFFALDSGDVVSPVVIGYSNSGYKVVPIERLVRSEAKTSYTKTREEIKVTEDKVLVETVVEDLNNSELKNKLLNELTEDPWGRVCFNLFNKVRKLEDKPEVTQDQFLSYVKGLI